MIRTLLIANRGEIACRIIRTASAMGIRTVALFSDPDADAPHVQMAGVAVRLPGSTPAETYLNQEAILSAARSAGADAIHPGYGFLAENASFATAVEEAGLVFVGPPASAIGLMGDKLQSKQLMDDVGVPTLPSETVDENDPAAWQAAAERIGYPVLVKASAGGGGKGMRIVAGPAGLSEAIDGARREAEAAFGDRTVFLEHYLEAPRHVEVQVFGDHFGNHVHLFERECSIQRRHQKIIEEAPSPAVTSELRKRMGGAAVAAAEAVGYVGAGTVEFLVEDDAFYFLEMNTRLQVEHPVTELVTGLDLVRLQLLVAERQPLPDEVLTAQLRGHAIEARLYAEDAAHDYLPQTGTLHRFRVEGPVRVDAGVQDGSVVSIHYDPMLAKIISYAPSRNEAARALAGSLADASIHGVVTNRSLLVRVLRHPEFLSGDTDTHFLERHDASVLARPLADDDARGRHAVAAAVCGERRRRAQARVLIDVPSGWRNNPSDMQRTVFESPFGELAVGYRYDRTGQRFELNGAELNVTVIDANATTADLEVDGMRRTYTVSRYGDEVYVDGPDGHSRFVEQTRFPTEQDEEAAGSLHSPMPGRVVDVRVVPGDAVTAGDVLVVVEAMKMEHSVRAPFSGTVEVVKVQAGDQVEADQILVVVQETS